MGKFQHQKQRAKAMKTLKILLAITVVLAISGIAFAYHMHAWIVQNEFQAIDTYGESVVVCSWKCVTDYNNEHYTQTQGYGACPYPY